MGQAVAGQTGAGQTGAGQAKFVEGNLLRHVTVMSLSASVGLMAIFVVDLINMVYISWLGDPDLTAAIGYAGAVMFFTTAIGIGLSIGVTVLVPKPWGRGMRALRGSGRPLVWCWAGLWAWRSRAWSGCCCRRLWI